MVLDEPTIRERLRRIDDKLEKLAEVVTQLALIEQQNRYSQEHLSQQEMRITKLCDRVLKLEQLQTRVLGIVVGVGAVAGTTGAQLLKVIVGP